VFRPSTCRTLRPPCDADGGRQCLGALTGLRSGIPQVHTYLNDPLDLSTSVSVYVLCIAASHCLRVSGPHVSASYRAVPSSYVVKGILALHASRVKTTMLRERLTRLSNYPMALLTNPIGPRHRCRILQRQPLRLFPGQSACFTFNMTPHPTRHSRVVPGKTERPWHRKL
jgi:hypothetical protein